MKLIEQEKANAEEGKRALIIAKVNSLVDENIIAALYEASKAGVEIQLIVRGICCLKPNVPNLSENITVRSIVGRYLEHSRIYYFHNDGDSLIYASSADWMSRNLDRRVELLFPIEAPEPRRRVLDILHANLNDTEKSRVLRSDGTYEKIDRNGKERLNCQDYFYKEAQESITYREAAFTSDDEFKPIFKTE
jgi:polyphosphate kinase